MADTISEGGPVVTGKLTKLQKQLRKEALTHKTAVRSDEGAKQLQDATTQIALEQLRSDKAVENSPDSKTATSPTSLPIPH